MRIAFICDIHGNLPAFQAVIRDMAGQGIDEVVFFGDLFFFGLYPQECYDALHTLSPSVCIKGNTDENIEEVDTFVPSTEFEKKLHDLIVFCDDRLTASAKKEIASWPIARPWNNVLCCHGSPYSFKEGLSPKLPLHTETEQKLRAESLELIVAGHTHVPADFLLAGKRVINPGAIGYSFGGDARASYAVWENGQVEFRYVDYDRKPYVMELTKLLGKYPLLESIVYAVENGRPWPRYENK